MSRVFVCGLGAVSPAGWGVSPLQSALKEGMPLPVHLLPSPGWKQPLRVRKVPNPIQRPPCLAHPRLRRASPLSHYAAAAAVEALAALPAETLAPQRLGLIVSLDAGCVDYSCRFYEELVKDPSLASPMLFPETVFSAPASHVAALFAHVPIVYSLIGDPGSFLQGIALAADWLAENTVDICLVIGAEESNWLLSDAIWRLDHAAIPSAGAGAIALTSNPALSTGAELALITDAFTVGARLNRVEAAAHMRSQMPSGAADELLCDGVNESLRTSAPELLAWKDWPGLRISPKPILGEGLVAAAAWQTISACAAFGASKSMAANISLVGNQQAIGARFVRHSSATTPSNP